MKKFLMITAAAGMVASAASAQDMTLAGAQVLLTEIPGASDCVEPAAPSVPDGSTSTVEEVLAARDAVAAYDSAVQDYQDCLNAAVSGMGDGLSEQHNQAVNIVDSNIVDKVTMLAEEMNAAIRAYNAANPD